MSEYFTIPVKEKTAEKLQADKRLGESWDDVVRRRVFGDDS